MVSIVVRQTLVQIATPDEMRGRVSAVNNVFIGASNEIGGFESGLAAQLMGTKTVLNEFVAYVELAHLPPDALGPRSRLMMTYALCGFANFGSLGILIGGMGAMAPERRGEIVALGLRSILSGTLATCMSGAVVGLLTDIGS